MASGEAWRGGRVGTELNGSISGDLGFLMLVRNLRADVEREAGHNGLELSEILLGEKLGQFHYCHVRE